MSLLAAISSSRRRGGAFSPLSLSPALWLDASDSSTLYDAASGGSLVAADGLIARWEDKSGNNRHVTQATNINQPQRKIAIKNGLDVVSLEADQSRYMTGSSILHSSEVTIFCIAKIPTAGGGGLGRAILQTSNAQNGLGVALTDSITAGKRNIYVRDVSNGVAGTHVANVWNLLSVKYLAGVRSFWLDKVNVTIATPNGTMKNPTAGIIIGNIDVSNYALQGSIAEILLYPTALSDTNRNAVETYLTSKWLN